MPFISSRLVGFVGAVLPAFSLASSSGRARLCQGEELILIKAFGVDQPLVRAFDRDQQLIELQM